MQRLSHYGWWSAALVTLILASVASRPRPAASDHSPLSIDDWSILELVAHLNRMGVNVQLHSTQQDGTLGQTVFLTTLDKSWLRLNALNKDAKRIDEWRGVLYCERVGYHSPAAHLYRDRGWEIGPFLFYGDAELLQRVRTALAPPASAAP